MRKVGCCQHAVSTLCTRADNENVSQECAFSSECRLGTVGERKTLTPAVSQEGQ